MKPSVKLTIFAVVLALASCGQKKDVEKPAPAPPVQKVEMDIPSGTKAPATEPVDTIPGQTHMKITCRCFATTDPDMLDLMPVDVKSAKKDTALLRQINEGKVYVVQPGESGYILAKENNRIQLRFPDKIAWVRISDTK